MRNSGTDKFPLERTFLNMSRNANWRFRPCVSRTVAPAVELPDTSITLPEMEPETWASKAPKGQSITRMHANREACFIGRVERGSSSLSGSLLNPVYVCGRADPIFQREIVLDEFLSYSPAEIIPNEVIVPHNSAPEDTLANQ